MKISELVVATVLRVGNKEHNLEPLTWSQLGDIFGMTDNAIRHKVNNFKIKFNIVDSDVVIGWNRKFLAEHTPNEDKIDKVKYISGDLIEGNKEFFVHIKTAEFWDGKAWDYKWKTTSEVSYEDGDIFHSLESFGSFVYLNEAIKSELTETKEEIEPLQYLVTPISLIVVRDGKALTIDKSHKNYQKIEVALKESRWNDALDGIDMKEVIKKYSYGRVVVEQGEVLFDGEPVPMKLTERLIDLLHEENLEALEALSKFLENCDENPDYRIVSRIYDFIRHNDIRIDKDGYILAYKVVRPDYKDQHSGTMDNSPGQVVKMKRNKVNSNDEVTCSHGLHVAAKQYITHGPMGSHWENPVVLCRVHPKDFVSIPTDYNDMKARVCEYTVLKDVTENFRYEEDGIEA